MVSYGTDELIPSSQFAKKFGSYLSLIQNNSVDKLAILKNNKIEAVLISKDEYEYMCKALGQIDNTKQNYTIDEKLLKKIVRTTQAIEGYDEATAKVQTKVHRLRERYGIKVST